MVALGLVNTLTALILVYTAQGLPLAIFILSEFMRRCRTTSRTPAGSTACREYRDLLPASCCR